MPLSLAVLCVPVEEHRDGLTIAPARPGFAVLDTFEAPSHRIAMSLAVLGAAAEGVELKNPACVSKTCPTLLNLLTEVGVETKRLPGLPANPRSRRRPASP